MGRRFRYFVTETLLWLLAGAGLIAILLVIAAYIFNTSVILFRTGSMEPTVPAGSAALVREIPASDVELGDILTVERPDRLPVTHRVISIELGDTAEERVITMQGDANNFPDSSPYAITEGKVLLGSVPGMANFINQLGNPYALGGITIAASVLVGWAFWPRSGPPSSLDHQNVQDTLAEGHQPLSSGSPPRYLWSVVGLVAVVAAPSAAQASATDVVEETIRSQYIKLTSIYDPTTREALTLSTSSAWDVGIDINAPSEGEGRAGLQAQGDIPLEVSVLACSVRWSDQPTSATQNTDACAGDSRTIAESLFVSPDGGLQWIYSFKTNDAPWLRLLVSIPSEGVEQPVGTAGLRVDVEAAGDNVSTDTEVTPGDVKAPELTMSPDPNLARTGSPVLVLLLVALSSMALGRWLHSRRGKKISR